MKRTKILLPDNYLYSKMMEQTEIAKNCGALKSIPTDYEIIEDNGIPFIVRILTNLVRKEKAKQEKSNNFNPFLPYEEDLFISDISDTHLCLLNKFNVVDNHLLIVTREFEEQESLLNLEDFIALCACMQQFDGLAFYNGGKVAGASVRHKHLQIVPLSLVPDLEQIPIETVINNCVENKITMFPFLHSFNKLDLDWRQHPQQLGKKVLNIYDNILNDLQISENDNKLLAKPYNLLMTKQWILVIPRASENFESISINSLGFSGALLVKNKAELELVKSYQPLNILKQVGKSLM